MFRETKNPMLTILDFLCFCHVLQLKIRAEVSNLSMWMRVFSGPCVCRLVGPHSDFCVPWTIQGSLVNVCWSHDYVFIINYHSFCMYIYHKSPKLLSCCLWRKPRFTDKDMQEWLSTVSSWINHHHTNLLIKI